MPAALKWYDSNWLRIYFSAKEIIAEVAPSKLGAFVDALRPLRTDPAFEVRDVSNLLGDQQLLEIKDAIRSIPISTMEAHEIKRFGRLIVHNHEAFTALQKALTDVVSDLAGEEVEPCYNFLSLYSRMGVCEPHLDAPSAKWTLDICIDQSDIWPIHFSQIVPWPELHIEFEGDWKTAIKESPDLRFESKSLRPGNAVLFSGSSQWHYRDPLPASDKNAFCDLVFLHYIPRGMAELVQPKNWARLFDVPELSKILHIERQY